MKIKRRTYRPSTCEWGIEYVASYNFQLSAMYFLLNTDDNLNTFSKVYTYASVWLPLANGKGLKEKTSSSNERERERRKKARTHNVDAKTVHNKILPSKWNEAKKRKWLMAGFKFLPFSDLFVDFFLLLFSSSSLKI